MVVCEIGGLIGGLGMACSRAGLGQQLHGFNWRLGCCNLIVVECWFIVDCRTHGLGICDLWCLCEMKG